MKLTYYVAASIDGFIAKEDGDVSWLDEFNISPEETGYEEFYASVDALVMGRNTYEMIVSFGGWPYGDKPVWVCTSGEVVACEACNLQSKLASDELVKVAEEMGLKHLWLVGGGTLAASFLEKSLLTNIIVTQIPTVLGGGIPLFASMGDSRLLSLESSTIVASQLVQNNYDVLNASG
jgi:dihydrofolate reductase